MDGTISADVIRICTTENVVQLCMMSSEHSTVVQLRVGQGLKQDFIEAARREQTTPSRVMRSLMESFVRESHRKEAERQSRIVAGAPDQTEIMDEIAELGRWMHD